MPYPDRLLADDEEVVRHVRPHGATLIGPAAVFVVVSGLASFGAASLVAPMGRLLILLPATVVVLRWSMLPMLRRQSTHVVLTDRRLLLRDGILTHTGYDVPLDRIQDVSVESTVAERLVGGGTLVIETGAESEPLVLPHLPDIDAVRRDLYELIEEAAATRSAPA